MPTIKELKKQRKKKLEAIKNAGRLAYPGDTKRTHTIGKALEKFDSLRDKKERITLTGRMRSKREHGKLTFCDIQDGKGEIQVVIKESKVGPKAYEFFLDNFDIGDFIEATGTLVETDTGEQSLAAVEYKMLSKALRPLPDKWHGLQDVEERYRKRYLDLLFNEDVKEKFVIRSKIIKAIRNFLENRGFLEMETPILQTIPGGANATPFETHLNALELDLYLRVAPELFLKRLLVGGFERVYEIGRCFRNEGMDKSHNPEFTSLEFYKAYSDYEDLMDFTEEMFEEVLQEVFGKLVIEYDGEEIDFSAPWERKGFSHLINKYADINYEDMHVEALREKARDLDIEIEDEDPKSEILDKIYKEYCKPEIKDPTFVIHHPEGSIPLAKSLEGSDKLANFQLVVGGWELINAFSELNDPVKQRERFEEQERLREEGLEEAQQLDQAFLEALEHGMPPAAGFGMGIDRLTALLTDSDSLREVIMFPLMKPKGNENTSGDN